MSCIYRYSICGFLIITIYDTIIYEFKKKNKKKRISLFLTDNFHSLKLFKHAVVPCTNRKIKFTFFNSNIFFL
jgi:hypothetical protein